MSQPYNGVVIAGYGETEYRKKTSLDSMAIIADAIHRALTDAGLSPTDVDGLSCTSFLMPEENTITVAAHLGLTLRWAMQGIYGNASGLIGVMQAARAIQAGDADVVVVAAADSYSVSKHMASTARFAPGTRDYLGIYGFGGSNGVFALVQQLHMQTYGTTREQLGKLAVTQRRHAQLNDNALLRSPLSLDDYLQARPIADPLRLYDCVLPCSGGDALVVTSEARARKLPTRPIHILSGGQRHNFEANSVVLLRRGWHDLAGELFGDAGIEPTDLDMLQLYDNYPIMELIQLEDFGFCVPGEGGAFIDATDFSLTGDLPLNTGGGQLSIGQAGAAGALLGAVEAVRQLRNEGGSRQLAHAETALVSGFGMVSYGRELSNSALILSRGRPS
jgi:acetyl-CoA acetyltransferase